MPYRYFVGLLLMVFAATGVMAHQEKASSGEKFIGTWTGTWTADAGGSGELEVTIDKDKDGAPAGKVAVTGEPTYKATFATLSFEGDKMQAKYLLPVDEQIEIVLAADFDGKTATGTWSARQKVDGGEVATGTWKVAKK